MRNIIGLGMMILSIVLGVYVGVWVCFIGGIIGLVNAVANIINGLGVDGLVIGFSIVKIMFAGLCGWISFAILFIPGYAMLK